MWDPHLGPVVEMGLKRRVVVELCFRDMGMMGFKQEPSFMQGNKGVKI